jgi:hypothetical protein
MIFPEYYGAAVFAAAQFEFDSGPVGHTMHVYTDVEVCYLLAITLTEVEFAGGVGGLATAMKFIGDTFKTEAYMIRGVL